MFNINESGPEVSSNTVLFRIFLPNIKKGKGFSIKVYLINKKGQFDVNIPANAYDLAPAIPPTGVDTMWGDVALASIGQVRVRGSRPLHWDYFYYIATDPGGATVLPLVTLYRKLGTLRRNHPAPRSPRENAKEESCNQNDKTLVYRRWSGSEVIIVALNFSDSYRSVPIPFGHAGKWEDILEASYSNAAPAYSIQVDNAAVNHGVPVPSNFGRMMRLC